MNELKIAQRTSRLSIVEDNLFRTSSSMGHCVSSDFFMRAGITKRFAQLYPKNEDRSFQRTDTMISLCILRPIIKKMDIPLNNETQFFPLTFLKCAEKQPHLDAQPCRGSMSEKHWTTANWMRHRQNSTINSE